MNIRPKNIPKFLGGKNIWYNGLIDYDPSKYTYTYDTSKLVNGDMSDTILSPWKSNISGYDLGRYLPTTGYGPFGKNKSHYNYTLGVELSDYYKNFGKDLLDSNGNFTETGIAWAKAVDKLLPKNSKASFFDENNLLRKQWTALDKDAHNYRGPQTFTDLKSYVNHVRNDQILGARHNVFLNRGKRYFYIDNEGQKHWVDPSVIEKYNISETPSEQGWEGTTYWDDYELTGLKNKNTQQTDPNKTIRGINPDETKDKESIWSKLGTGLKNVAPDLLDALRLAGNMHNNDRVYNESMKAIRPNLQQSYHTYRQVVGDEATKLAYYRRAVQGQTKAGQPFTADADRLVTYMNEAKRIGDELRALGDLADNLRVRETSDESNQHQWANKQRDTEVANNNTTEINKADAAKHQLTAQKYSADWTNIEQYLMGRLYKLEKEKAELKELQKQLTLLDALEKLIGDTKLRDLKTAYDEAYDAYYNEKDPTKKAALKLKYEKIANDYLLHKIQKSREALKLQYGKEGTKIERKRKDDSLKYLYRTSRDIVEHFRRMSKMTDDSRVRTLPKTVKLSSHPRKMLLGGVAPFTIYRPLGVGGESAISTQTSSSGGSKSEKDTAAKDKLDMIKELFKSVQGLPIDASKVYSLITGLLSKYKAFGEEMSTDDIASMYLSAMNQINHLKYSLDAYNKAHAQAVANDALNEIAVGANGELYVQNMETGEIKRTSFSSLKDLEGNWNPLNNSLLLTMRAHSPNLAFNDDVFNVVNNGIGLTKIAAQIKSMAALLGSSTEKIEGITEVESKLVRAGLQILAGTGGTPDGHYQVTNNTKLQTLLVKAALNYIYTMLPKNYKTILNIHSNGLAESLIASFLTSLADSVIELTITPLTGKASKENKDSNEKIKSNPLMQMILGEGGVPRRWELVTRDTNTRLSVDGMFYSEIPKVKDDMSIDKMLSESGISGILDSKQGITFGDLPISPEQLKDVMYSNTGGMIVTLPCKIVNGHKEINLGIKQTYEEAVLEVESAGISKNSPEYSKTLGTVLKNKGLNSLVDNNGNIDKTKFGLFLVVEAYTTDKIKGLDTSSQYIEKVNNPTDELELRLVKALSTNDKKDDYSIDINYWIWGDDVYRGTVFIPLTNNLNASINAWGNLINVEDARELENKFQNFNKASTMKSSNSNILYETK